MLYQYHIIEFVKIYTRMPKKAQSSLSKVRVYEVRYPTEFIATTRGELFYSTFVKYKCNFFNFLVQQKLALLITILAFLSSSLLLICRKTSEALCLHNLLSEKLRYYFPVQIFFLAV